MITFREEPQERRVRLLETVERVRTSCVRALYRGDEPRAMFYQGVLDGLTLECQDAVVFSAIVEAGSAISQLKSTCYGKPNSRDVEREGEPVQLPSLETLAGSRRTA